MFEAYNLFICHQMCVFLYLNNHLAVNLITFEFFHNMYIEQYLQFLTYYN